MTAQALAIEVTDVSLQKRAKVEDIPRESTVGDLIEGVLSDLRLPQADEDGRPVSYQAMSFRQQRHLHASEVVGDVLETGDRLTLAPNVEAG